MQGPNEALWLPRPGGRLRPGPAPSTAPAPDELVVRVRAVAVNPVDAIPGIARRVVTPWLTYPAVLGSDVAGEVVDVGERVTRFGAGDRVLGHAIGQERARNRPAEGAFQRYVILVEHMASPLPDGVSYEQGAVLPLGLSTAAAGLFERDQLALAFPTLGAPDRGACVVVWGGSTSVGSNAIQLARSAGYDVIATASARNFDYVRRLGASEVLDYHDRDVEREIAEASRGRELAGILAIGKGSLARAVRIAAQTDASRRVASVYPSPVTAARAALARRRGVHVSAIWGGTPSESSVGPAIYGDFLGAALAAGRYRPAPAPDVVGSGLAAVPEALGRLRTGVSASKLVVSLAGE